MVQNRSVLVLRAEKDHLRVLFGSHRVPRRPVKQITRTRIFLSSVLETDGKLAFDQIAPTGSLTEVILQTLEERRQIGTGRNSLMFSSDGAETCSVSKICLLARDGAGRRIDLDRDIFFRYAH